MSELDEVLNTLINQKKELEEKIRLALLCVGPYHITNYIIDTTNKLVICEQSIKYVKGKLNENVNV